MNWIAPWITPACDMGSQAPCFAKAFRTEKPVASAVLRMTAMGVYDAAINGKPVTDTVLNPGWTTYQKRLQVQTWDVTDHIGAENELTVTVGKGWYRSPLIRHWGGTIQTERMKLPAAITAELTLTYQDGTRDVILTDESWTASEGVVRFSELYDGEVVDATFVPAEKPNAVLYDGPTDTLIPHEGAPICEHERIRAARVFTTPRERTSSTSARRSPASSKLPWTPMPVMWWMFPSPRSWTSRVTSTPRITVTPSAGIITPAARAIRSTRPA